MLEPDLIAHLSALVPSVAGRVHLGNAPQGTVLPAVVVRRISGSTPRTLGNVRLFQRADVSVDCIADGQYAPAMLAANEVLAALDGFRGAMGADTYCESVRCAAEPTDNSLVDGDLVVRQLTQDFKFVYRSA